MPAINPLPFRPAPVPPAPRPAPAATPVAPKAVVAGLSPLKASGLPDAPGVKKLDLGMTAKDGTRIAARTWLPTMEAPRGVLVINHGLKDHSGTYDKLASELAFRTGFAVYALDMRGHGRSGGTPVRVGRFDDYVDDLAAFTAAVKAAQPNVPVIMYGHSMGGQVVTRFLERQPGVQGAVLAAPALKPTGADGTLWERLVTAIKIPLAKVLSKVWPSLPLLDLPNKDFSPDPKVVAAMNADPLVHQGKLSVHTANELVGAIKDTAKHFDRIDVPLLIAQGDHDTIVAQTGAADLAKGAASSDKTFVKYPGAYHGLHLEPSADRLLQDLRPWLDHHTPIPARTIHRGHG